MGIAPSRYPPPVDSAKEFTGLPTDPVDERVEVGVAIVGAGPAGLACANRLMRLLEHEPELAKLLGEVPVAVVEKGRAPGAHELSGAIMRPRPSGSSGRICPRTSGRATARWPACSVRSGRCASRRRRRSRTKAITSCRSLSSPGGWPSGRRRLASTSWPRQLPRSSWSRTEWCGAYGPAIKVVAAMAKSWATSSPAQTS
jgi:hypothetical protein